MRDKGPRKRVQETEPPQIERTSEYTPLVLHLLLAIIVLSVCPQFFLLGGMLHDFEDLVGRPERLVFLLIILVIQQLPVVLIRWSGLMKQVEIDIKSPDPLAMKPYVYTALAIIMASIAVFLYILVTISM
jgi:hypothetical protein